MTPAELNLCIEVYVEKNKLETEDKLFGQWINAYWQRVETLKPFKEEIKSNDEKPKGMTPEEMFGNVLKLNAEMNGTVEK